MIGDQSPFRFQSGGIRLAATTVGTPGPPPPPPQPQPQPEPPGRPRQGSLFPPSVRNFKIAENMSPRPQDRVFYSFNFFDNVNSSINQREGVPLTNVKAYRHFWGFEKTFNDGQGSVGMRIPLNTVTADSRVMSTPTSTSLGDLTIFGKYILQQNRQTGSLVSVGLAITPPTGPGSFGGTPYLAGLRSTYIQPSLGYIWNRGRFYLQGFSAFDFSVNPNDVSLMYNDVGVGYYVYRSSDPGAFLTALAPTFEAHVNTPLNHRDPFNRFDIAGTPDIVNLTYGLNCQFRRRSVLTFALVTPVTNPEPFNVEAAILFNYYFGKSRPIAPTLATPPLL